MTNYSPFLAKSKIQQKNDKKNGGEAGHLFGTPTVPRCVWHRVNNLCVHACKFVYVQFMFMFILKVTVYTTVDG